MSRENASFVKLAVFSGLIVICSGYLKKTFYFSEKSSVSCSSTNSIKSTTVMMTRTICGLHCAEQRNPKCHAFELNGEVCELCMTQASATHTPWSGTSYSLVKSFNPNEGSIQTLLTLVTLKGHCPDIMPKLWDQLILINKKKMIYESKMYFNTSLIHRSSFFYLLK